MRKLADVGSTPIKTPLLNSRCRRKSFVEKFSGKFFGRTIFVETEDRLSALLIIDSLSTFLALDYTKTDRNTFTFSEDELAKFRKLGGCCSSPVGVIDNMKKFKDFYVLALAEVSSDRQFLSDKLGAQSSLCDAMLFTKKQVNDLQKQRKGLICYSLLDLMRGCS